MDRHAQHPCSVFCHAFVHSVALRHCKNTVPVYISPLLQLQSGDLANESLSSTNTSQKSLKFQGCLQYFLRGISKKYNFGIFSANLWYFQRDKKGRLGEGLLCKLFSFLKLRMFSMRVLWNLILITLPNKGCKTHPLFFSQQPTVKEMCSDAWHCNLARIHLIGNHTQSLELLMKKKKEKISRGFQEHAANPPPLPPPKDNFESQTKICAIWGILETNLKKSSTLNWLIFMTNISFVPSTCIHRFIILIFTGKKRYAFFHG